MWLFFTLLTTLLWGIAELFYKKGSHEDERYGHLRVCILVGAVMGIHAVFTLLTSDVAYDPMNLIAYLPVSLCYIVSMACSFFGIRFIEESLSDPIENTSGAMCSLLCVIFLGETIDPIIWVAIAIIVVGIIGVSYTERTSSIERRERLGKRLAIIAFAMPFCYAIIDALGSFLDIYFLEMETSPLIGVNGLSIIAHGSATGVAILNAIRMACDLHRNNVNEQIIKCMEAINPALKEIESQEAPSAH